ncbi:MAG TPA: PAS domain-containing protein, partial [Deltaproteobacteria bacterium]|nr:PAS domain-containing protein [Deltaproteobacteria bacterium]
MPSKALRAAFASNPTAIGITDLSTGRVIEVNEAFTRLTGCSRE